MMTVLGPVELIEFMAGSLNLLGADLPGMTQAHITNLEAAGITSIRNLGEAKAVTVVRAARVFPGQAASWQAVARLMTVPGLSSDAAQALQGVGIMDPVMLGRTPPEWIREQLQGNGSIVVGDQAARRWVEAAKSIRIR